MDGPKEAPTARGSGHAMPRPLLLLQRQIKSTAGQGDERATGACTPESAGTSQQNLVPSAESSGFRACLPPRPLRILPSATSTRHFRPDPSFSRVVNEAFSAGWLYRPKARSSTCCWRLTRPSLPPCCLVKCCGGEHRSWESRLRTRSQDGVGIFQEIDGAVPIMAGLQE